MRWLYIVPLRLRSILRRSRLDEELHDEFRYHLESQIEHNLARGMGPEEARYAALRALDGPEQRKEECRDKRRVNFFDHLAQDLRYALRTLRKTPAFTLGAVISLAVGIGVNTAVFSLLSTLLMTKLAARDADHLYQLVATRRTYTRNGFSVTDYEQLRSHVDILQDIAAWFHREWTFQTENSQLSVHGALVSGNFYDFMGVKPVVGRLIEPADDTAGGSSVAVLGYGFWQREFLGDRGVLGKIIRIEGAPFTIIGVTPRDFGGAEADYPRDVILPIRALKRYDPKDVTIENPGSYYFSVLVRLKPGVTMESARPVLRDVWPRLANNESGSGDYFQPRLDIAPGSAGASRVRNEFSRPLLIVMVLVTMVLLIMCANLANLLLVRGLGRKKEIAVRLAIGANRARLVRQTLTEAFMVAAVGGCAGLFLAPWFVRGFLVFLPATQAGFLAFRLDTRVLVSGALLTLGTALVFGILPAFQAVRVPLNVIMGEAGRVPGAGRRPLLLRVVVAAQVAVSTVLVASSLMFAKSLQNISNTDLGFKRDNLLLADLNLAGAGIRGEQKDIFLKHLLDNLNAAPGIASASLSRLTPLSGLQWWDVAAVPGYTPARDEATTIYINQVTPAYFQTLGIPLVEGREFTPSDDHSSRRVAIVSQSFARRFYQDRPALGRVFSVGPGAGADPNYEMFRNLQIVGIVADTKYSDPHESQKDVVYFASYQAGIFDMRGSLEIRLVPGADGLQGSKQIRTEVNRLASGLEVDIRPYDSVFERSLQRDRLLAVLAGIFGLVGLVLACVGLYGVMAHTVAARTGEIGIRMTLGARGLQVEWMVVREALVLAGTGALAGVPLAWASGQFARDLLYGLEPSDQVVFAASLGIMIVVSAAAAWIPARRAARVDPMFALRHE